MRFFFLIAGLVCSLPAAAALSAEAKEFLDIARQLEPLHCEKRKLRREIVLADTERRDADARAARAKFNSLDRDPKTARLEKRLGELERKIVNGRGGVPQREDLDAISYQQREAYHRCE